jgi:hypothetical protein
VEPTHEAETTASAARDLALLADAPSEQVADAGVRSRVPVAPEPRIRVRKPQPRAAAPKPAPLQQPASIATPAKPGPTDTPD